MFYKIKRTDREINEVLDKCAEYEDTSEQPYWGMTYTQGIEAAIRWLTDESQESVF